MLVGDGATCDGSSRRSGKMEFRRIAPADSTRWPRPPRFLPAGRGPAPGCERHAIQLRRPICRLAGSFRQLAVPPPGYEPPGALDPPETKRYSRPGRATPTAYGSPACSDRLGPPRRVGRVRVKTNCALPATRSAGRRLGIGKSVGPVGHHREPRKCQRPRGLRGALFESRAGLASPVVGLPRLPVVLKASCEDRRSVADGVTSPLPPWQPHRRAPGRVPAGGIAPTHY